MIERTKGNPPFVIDRRLPSAIFERAPGAYSLVRRAEGEEPLEFNSIEEAEETLRTELPPQTLDAYEFRIMPTEKVLGYGTSEWEASDW